MVCLWMGLALPFYRLAEVDLQIEKTDVGRCQCRKFADQHHPQIPFGIAFRELPSLADIDRHFCQLLAFDGRAEGLKLLFERNDGSLLLFDQMVLVAEGGGADQNNGDEGRKDGLIDPLDARFPLLVPAGEHQVRRIVVVRQGEAQGRPEGDPLREGAEIVPVRDIGRFSHRRGDPEQSLRSPAGLPYSRRWAG